MKFLNLKNLFESKFMKGIIIGLAVMAFILIIFKLGTLAGYRKARFTDNFGAHYERNFMGEPRFDKKDFRGRMGNMMPPQMGEHGTFGEIISIDSERIIVAEPNNPERLVRINESTLIRHADPAQQNTPLEVGMSIVVLGESNDAGELVAKLIRVIPNMARPARNPR